MVKRTILLLGILAATFVKAQEVKTYKPQGVKILFLLDVSGSMKEQWNGKSRLAIAKEALIDMMDSIQKKYPNTHLGLRVFGSEFLREQKNCKDTRLIVPLTKNLDLKSLKSKLDGLAPKGMTPIAYSLEQAAKDFTIDSNNVNSIILITDGDENCEGDPCKFSDLLIKRKISFRPFIIGLGVEKNIEQRFDCIGTFLNTSNEVSLRQSLEVVVRQSMNVTSAQINLIDRNGQPLITNIPFTIYDQNSMNIEYNFVHTIKPTGMPDTLFLNPMGQFKIVVHTTPPIIKENVELQIGKHNVIGIDLPIGKHSPICNGSSFTTNDAQIIVKNIDNKTLSAQELNTKENLVVGNYKIAVLTNPFFFDTISIMQDQETEKNILNYGSAIFYSQKNMNAFILYNDFGKWKKTNEFMISSKYETIKLQPGSYRLVYIPVGSTETLSSKVFQFEIEEGRNLSISLE